MKLELQSAANFLIHLIRLGRRNIGENQLEKFRLALVEVLRRRYRDHWFPERPFKGSGYRCIRINGKMDPVIMQAGEACGLSAQLIHATFPSELTMWIDPLEVSYRIGENGSVCVLYEFKEGSVNEPWRPSTQSLAAASAGSNSNNHKNNNKMIKPMKAPSSEASSPASSASPVATPPPSVGGDMSGPLSCGKDTLRSKMELLLGADPSRSASSGVSIEQLASYVTSS